MTRGRVPRELHPVAWWIWAVGLVIAANRTTNPLLLVLLLAVLALVVANRRGSAPWARAFRYYLILGGVVIALRVLLRCVFGTGVATGDHVLLTLPRIPMPHWYSGVQLGGPVSVEALLAAAVDGLRLATILCCIGAANALANPRRALRILPGALSELGTAVAVAISLAPQLIESVQRVARARRLRGGRRRGWRVLHAIAIPVLADALDRSLMLAAAMDSRGYGRTGTATARSRRLTAALMAVGLLGLCAGVYGLLGASAPRWLGTPMLAGGLVLCVGGLALGSRRVTRTHYRPDPWRAPEWAVALCGLAAAAVLCAHPGVGGGALNPSFSPLRFPPLPPLPAVAILVAALPALLAPPPPRSLRSSPAARPPVSDPAEETVDVPEGVVA
jgi:energy-coupling factor transport system permease protein